MNPDRNNSTDHFVANSLQQRFSLAAPENVKAALLYRCGEAAAESKIRRRRLQSGWGSAAMIFLALGLGGIAGRLSNQTSTTDNLVKSNHAVETTNEDRVTPNSDWSLTSNPKASHVRPANALNAGMDVDRVMQTLAKKQPATTSLSLEAESSTRPLSVWMSHRDLTSLTSF